MKPKNQPGASPSDVANADASEKQAEAIDVLATDEHAGKPGSFVFDPATRKRSKVAE